MGTRGAGQDRVERLVSWSPDQLGAVMEDPGLGGTFGHRVHVSHLSS